MYINIIIIILILLILIWYCYCSFSNNNNNIEEYTPIINRFPNYVKNENDCIKPYTNNTKYEWNNEKIATNQYANRQLLNPNQYLDMIRKLLKDLSVNKINIHDYDLVETEYKNNTDYITNCLNKKINEIIVSKKYLQNNGNWIYENIYSREPIIYMFKDKNSTLIVYKVIFVLANPLRSSYTSCFCFITEINNNLEIQYAELTNDINDNKLKDNLGVIESEKVNFILLNTIGDITFDKCGNTSESSGLDYINDTKLPKINIEETIPDEFKEPKQVKQYLPPEFGNGVLYRTQ
tara:strand:- start:57 stop:935 length:879 start_codon:yes stop_codon:yes gene_type:complete